MRSIQLLRTSFKYVLLLLAVCSALLFAYFITSRSAAAQNTCQRAEVTNSCTRVIHGDGVSCTHCQINGCPPGTSGQAICIPDAPDCSCTFFCYSACQPADDNPPVEPPEPSPPAPTPTPPAEPPSGWINASPNPCTIASGATVCTSNITWDSQNVDSAEVVVSATGGAESQFSSNGSCSGNSCPANFIGAPPRYYDFMLYGYAEGSRVFLAEKRVTATIETVPVCPSAQAVFVVLADTTLNTGETTTAFAPNGWSGGLFVSSNTGVATIGNTQGNSAVVTAQAVGSSPISGVGWIAANGATGCELGPWTLFVEPNGAAGQIRANPNPIPVCPPETLGVTTITAKAGVYAEVRVFNAEGRPDNSLFFTLVANEEKSAPTGKWVRDGTVFVLLAPFNGNAELARVTVTHTKSGCGGGGGPTTESWVYNTNTAPSAGLIVACDNLYAVWTRASVPVDGYKIYYLDTNTGAWTAVKTVLNNQAVQLSQDRLGVTFTPVMPQPPLRYRIYTYTGAGETAAQKDAHGSPIAPVLCGGGQPNLDPSNKDITKIRNMELCFYERTKPVCNLYNDQDSPVSLALPVIEGDTVSFAINLVNGGLDPITVPIQIDDVLTNLVEPPKGFNLRASCVENSQCQLKDFSYNQTTHRFNLRVVPIGGNSLAPQGQEVWSLAFTGRTEAPAGKRGQPFRFRNQAYVNSRTGPLLTTPYILVLPVGAPTIEEIQ